MRNDETGGIISSWLLQMVIFLAVIALIGYEAITIAVTSINLQDEARDVARAAARAYKSDQRISAAQDAAEAEAEGKGVTLVEVTENDGVVTASVTKEASTFFVHNIGLFDDLVEADAQGDARWR